MQTSEMVLWFLLLIVQNASFTWVSRARNSSSLGYHAIAAVGSNGIFIVNQLLLISNVMVSLRTMRWPQLTGICLLYISGTVVGSVLMHWISLKYLETGKKRVGLSPEQIEAMIDSAIARSRTPLTPLLTLGETSRLPLVGLESSSKHASEDKRS